MADMTRPKVLVVYFSRSGVTQRLAEAVARATTGDLEQLRERRSRRGLLGWLRSGYEGSYQLSAEILPLQRDLRAYDLVVVGSPTWNKAVCSPVRGFLRSHAATLPNVALFATCQGKGADLVVAQMAALLPGVPLASLTMRERDVKASSAPVVGEFCERALAALEQTRRQIA